MQKILLFLLSATLLGACAAQQAFIRPDAASMPFISHTGPGAFDNVLAQNLPYENFKTLRAELNKHVGGELDFYKGWNPRGEAHVTVITPVEYWEALRPYMSMEEINQIARENHIQQHAPEILGMGTGRLDIDGTEEKTYFVIVAAPHLLQVRRAVCKEFVRRGGKAEDFIPEVFYPHVTVAYTKRDLHIQDGVIKDMPHSHTPELDPLLHKIFSR